MKEVEADALVRLAVARERKAFREFVTYLGQRDNPAIAWEVPFLLKWLDKREEEDGIRGE